MAIIPDNGKKNRNFISNDPSFLGYHQESNQSPIALKFLRWLARETGWQIQTRDSPRGEQRVWLQGRGDSCRPISLDGYVADKKLAIEFLGCAWHGCKWYFTRDFFTKIF